MSLTRRRLFQFAVSDRSPASDWISARGREAAVAEGSLEFGQRAASSGSNSNLIRIASNENPLGPGQHVLDVIVGKFPEASRYPFNAKQREPVFVEAIAKKFGVSNDMVTLGAGSGEILVNAVRAFTSPTKPFVAADPTWENPRQMAVKIGTPVRAVPVDKDLRIDLTKMVEASKGAGLVFFCNPNNPTGTVHSHLAVANFVNILRTLSPDTVIIIDEAYHDYVTDPNYKTAADLAKSTPKVLVARTMSKAYGMAGMRVGYAFGDKEVVNTLNRFRMPYGINLPAIGAATVALGHQAHIDAERKRNTEVKAFTLKAFEQMGFKATDSQTNFIFVNLNRPAKPFRDACAQHGVIVGRDFPPFEKTHCRISIGTMAEMQKAVDVFKKVLGSATSTSNQARR